MEIILLIVLLAIAAETTYLVANQTGKTKHSKKQQTPIFVDTSVLIDGRIVSIAQSGFITSTLYIPRSVVGELQFLADNADTDKRSRARHGLDIVSELQGISQVKTEIFSDSTKAEEGVDNRLLKLAKQYKGAICTIDFNLNKVAQVEGIPVLNVNDLAKTLRMAYLPGEKIKLELTQKGNDSHQAIGHLVDGTMVVVEHAQQFIGKSVEIEFIRSLQTAAGKMMFARVVGNQPNQPAKPKNAPKNVQNPRAAKVVKQVERPGKPQTQRAPKPAQAPVQEKQVQNQPAAQQAPKRPQQQRRNSRRTPEDSMVELANQ